MPPYPTRKKLVFELGFSAAVCRRNHRQGRALYVAKIKGQQQLAKKTDRSQNTQHQIFMASFLMIAYAYE